MAETDFDWDEDGNVGFVHVYPVGDLKEHEMSEDCWCRPYVREGPGIIVHNSLDRREEYEQCVH